MSTPKRAAAASERWAAARPPIRRGATMPRTRRATPVVEEYSDCGDYDDYGLAPVVVRRQRVAHAPEPRQQSSGGVLWGIVFLVIGVAMGYMLITRGYIPIPVETAQQAMPTAGIAPRPTYPPAPTPNDYGVAAYNAAHAPAQEQPAPTPPPTDAPAPVIVAQEGAGDVVEATPLPAPDEPTFKDSFQESTCSAMITYFKGNPCYGRTGQAPLPAAGSSAFAQSFK